MCMTIHPVIVLSHVLQPLEPEISFLCQTVVWFDPSTARQNRLAPDFLHINFNMAHQKSNCIPLTPKPAVTGRAR